MSGFTENNVLEERPQELPHRHTRHEYRAYYTVICCSHFSSFITPEVLDGFPLRGHRSYLTFRQVIVYRIRPIIPISEQPILEMVKVVQRLLYVATLIWLLFRQLLTQQSSQLILYSCHHIPPLQPACLLLRMMLLLLFRLSLNYRIRYHHCYPYPLFSCSPSLAWRYLYSVVYCRITAFSFLPAAPPNRLSSCPTWLTACSFALLLNPYSAAHDPFLPKLFLFPTTIPCRRLVLSYSDSLPPGSSLLNATTAISVYSVALLSYSYSNYLSPVTMTSYAQNLTAHLV